MLERKTVIKVMDKGADGSSTSRGGRERRSDVLCSRRSCSQREGGRGVRRGGLVRADLLRGRRVFMGLTRPVEGGEFWWLHLGLPKAD